MPKQERTTFVVAIDGPAGAGKSTVSRRLAETLGYTFLDTGALYRSVAFFASRGAPAIPDEAKLAEIAQSIDVRFEPDAGMIRVWANGEDVSAAIRKPEVSQLASKVSAYPRVRSALLEAQRRVANNASVVAEGRDIGTVVFPKAQAKFFLTASQEKRAQRRTLELAAEGKAGVYAEVLAAIKERDERDSSREAAPLRQAEDALLVDSSEKTIDEVISFMLNTVRERGG